MGNVQGADGSSDGSSSTGREAIGARVEIAGRVFRVEKQLGEGGFAYVFKVMEEATAKPFALKRILAGDSETAKIAEQEINIMKLCTSRNVINYKGHAVNTKPKRGGHRSPVEYLILMEYCPGGTLTQFLADQKDVPLAEAAAISIALDVSSAVRVLHTQMPPICHRDLKLDNVLLGQDRVWRLCDFGSATTRVKAYETKEEITLEEELIQQYTTASYRAPEMANLWQRRVVGPKADIWALGCILYTIIYLKHPFQNGTKARVSFPSNTNYSSTFVDLIRAMLTEDPDARPNIVDVVDYLTTMQRGERPRLRKPSASEKTSRKRGQSKTAAKPKINVKKKESSASPGSSSGEDDDPEPKPTPRPKSSPKKPSDDAGVKDMWDSMTRAPAQTDLLGLFDPLAPAATNSAVPAAWTAAKSPPPPPVNDWVQF